MEENPTSPMQGNNTPTHGTSSLGLVVEKVTALSSVSEHSNKRDFSDVMDTEEEDATNTPKKQKLDDARKLVHVAGGKGKKKQLKVKGPAFEVQEYEFSQTPKGSTNIYKSKTELLDKYKENKDITTNESLKFSAEVRKVSHAPIC